MMKLSKNCKKLCSACFYGLKEIIFNVIQCLPIHLLFFFTYSKFTNLIFLKAPFVYSTKLLKNEHEILYKLGLLTGKLCS